jgi:hypothetical protein
VTHGFFIFWTIPAFWTRNLLQKGVFTSQFEAADNFGKISKSDKKSYLYNNSVILKRYCMLSQLPFQLVTSVYCS